MNKKLVRDHRPCLTNDEDRQLFPPVETQVCGNDTHQAQTIISAALHRRDMDDCYSNILSGYSLAQLLHSRHLLAKIQSRLPDFNGLFAGFAYQDTFPCPLSTLKQQNVVSL